MNQNKADELLTTGYGDLMEETATGPGLWLKVPHRGALRAVLMQVNPVRYTAHWVRGGYQLCRGHKECTWCDLGLATKIRYVYAMYDADRKRAGILEVSPDTASQIRDIAQRTGNEPGVLIRMTKAGAIINGAIKCEQLHDWYRLDNLPPGPDIAQALQRQWDDARERLPL